MPPLAPLVGVRQALHLQRVCHRAKHAWPSLLPPCAEVLLLEKLLPRSCLFSIARSVRVSANCSCGAAFLHPRCNTLHRRCRLCGWAPPNNPGAHAPSQQRGTGLGRGAAPSPSPTLGTRSGGAPHPRPPPLTGKQGHAQASPGRGFPAPVSLELCSLVGQAPGGQRSCPRGARQGRGAVGKHPWARPKGTGCPRPRRGGGQGCFSTAGARTTSVTSERPALGRSSVSPLRVATLLRS